MIVMIKCRCLDNKCIVKLSYVYAVVVATKAIVVTFVSGIAFDSKTKNENIFFLE